MKSVRRATAEMANPEQQGLKRTDPATTRSRF